MSEIIPNSVIEKAKGLVELYGNRLEFCGAYQGRDVYIFRFPGNKETGFPFVYIYDVATDSVQEVTGFDALHLLSDIMDK